MSEENKPPEATQPPPAQPAHPADNRPYEGVQSSSDLNAETVAALQKASESLKAQEEASNARDREYLGLAAEAKKEAETAAADAGAPQEAAPQGDQQPAAAALPESTPGQQPQFSESTVDAMERLVRSQQELEKREQALQPKEERFGKLEKLFKEKYGTDRIGTIKELIELGTGLRGSDELQGAFDEYTLQVLGVEPDSESKAQSETRRLRLDVENLKKQQTEAEAKRQQEAEQSANKAQTAESLKIIGQELGKSTESYPFLAALQSADLPNEQDASTMVWNRIVSAQKETGKQMTLEQAFKAEEDRIRETLEPFRDLLSKAGGDSAKKHEPASPGPQTISSSMTSAPSTPSAPETGYIEDDDASRQRGVAILEAMNRQRASNGVT